MYFSWATDLDPKGVNSQIKEAILSPGQGDDDSPPTQSGIHGYCILILRDPFQVLDNLQKYLLFLT